MKHRRKQVWAMVICVTLQVTAALSYSAFVYYQTGLMNHLEANFLSRTLLKTTTVFLALWVLLELLENVSREKLYASISKDIKQRAAQAFLFQNLPAHGMKSDEDYMAYFMNQVNAVLTQHFYLRLYVGKAVIMFIFSLITLLAITWQCGLAVIAASIFFRLLIHRTEAGLSEKQKELQKKSAVFVGGVMEQINGWEEIHLNQMEALAKQDFDAANQDMEHARFSYQAALIRLESFNVSGNILIYLLILIIGCSLAHRNLVGIGVFISAAELSVQALNQYAVISRLYAKVKGSKTIKQELDEFIVAEPARARSVAAGDGDLLASVSHLDFQYDEEALLLNDVSFSIHRGEKLLIVGESGSGKSTLLRLLMGYLKGKKGDVVLYTDRIAYVRQSPFLFAGSLRENLVFNRDSNDQEILDILQKLELSMSLDMRIEEDGENLSGGQKVRVALARALLTHPELLVIDELSASLDQELGEKLEQMLLDLPEMALCSVSHRVYCREQYDMVLELKRMRKESKA